jgi:hypothetical protein
VGKDAGFVTEMILRIFFECDLHTNKVGGINRQKDGKLAVGRSRNKFWCPI